MLPPKEIPNSAKPIVRKALIVGLVCGLLLGALAGFIVGTHIATQTYVIVPGEGQKA
jgi:hypothetical protein